MSGSVQVAGVQMDVTLGDVAKNLRKVIESLEQTSKQGAILTVFPECALTGYCFESLAEAMPFAEPVPGPSTAALSAACQRLQTSAVVGMLERDGDKIYNACVLVGPEGLVGCYRKIHLPFLGIDRFTTPGDRPPQIWTSQGLRIGMHICYDGSFPEEARCMALDGADVIALPTNWPPGAEYMAEHLINARAVENHLYFLAVNRVGEERGFRFIGRSRFANPHGADLDYLNHDREGILQGLVDPQLARRKKIVRTAGKHEIDRFADRRPQMYQRLVQPNALTTSRADDAVFPPPSSAEEPATYQHLWAPWRLSYIQKGSESAKVQPPSSQNGSPECFICRAAQTDSDRESLVVARSESTVTLLNRFPYNNGHLLVCPAAHKAALHELDATEQLAILSEVTRMTMLLQETIRAEGFNIGLNLGRVAGAGVPGHLHWHIVPRWYGDNNFMPTLAGVRVIPQSLEALWEILTQAVSSAQPAQAVQTPAT